MDFEFSNRQIDPESMPSIAEINFSGLHKDYLTVGIISNVILWSIIGGAALIIMLLREEVTPSWIKISIAGLLAAMVILSFTVQILGFRRKLYAVREKDIMYKSGLIWRSAIIIPFNRVQHAEVNQGPLDRLFDLSYLKIYTAGGSSSDLAIPGLRPEKANRIKHFVLSKTSMDEEE